METLCSSIIPVKFHDALLAKRLVDNCINEGLFQTYDKYVGKLNLTKIKDINVSQFNLFTLPSEQIDIQCVLNESTLLVVLTWENEYDDYYQMVDKLLKKKNIIVKRILGYYSEDAQLNRLLGLLKACHDKNESQIYYAFTFYSILDKDFSEENTIHLKVLAEPSVIQMDDMQSSDITEMSYCPEISLDEKLLSSVEDIDLYTEQQTYITWATIVTMSKKRDIFIDNHITLLLLEIHVQRIWNLCYSQNIELSGFITDINKKKKEIPNAIISTYRILVDSKNCVSATYSSRVSVLYKTIVESSQLEKNIEDLEQKLNYLIVLTNTINQQKNRNVQESSEILLFLIAIAQVIPIFFDLPMVTHRVISIVTVALIGIVGIMLIRIKYRE